MKRTEVPVVSVPGFIRPESGMLSLGSCFAENIGLRLCKAGYDISVNPPGILFNPFSIETALRNAIRRSVEKQHFDSFQGTSIHFDYHSRMNGADESAVNKNVEKASGIMESRLLSGDRLFITFGTSWVFQLNRTGKIIANCHRVPQKEFTKVLLDCDDLKQSWFGLLSELLALNPKLRIVLTVSPVRHTRKGIHENNVSKAILLLLCDHLEKSFEQVHYFPAYEIVLDELRDYRFFKDDLIHPNDEALEIVYNRFVASYCGV